MKINIIYMDGKEIQVSISTKDSKKFFESLSNHQIYFDDDKGKGFWTDMNKVRFLNVEETVQPKSRSSNRSDERDCVNKSNGSEQKEEPEPEAK